MNLYQDYTLSKGIRTIFIITVCSILAGSVIDFFLLPPSTKVLEVLSLISIVLYSTSLYLFFVKRVAITVCFAISSYTFLFYALCIIFLSTNSHLGFIYLRFATFIVILATISAYIIDRFQPLIIAGIFIVSSLFFYASRPVFNSINYLVDLLGIFIMYVFTINYLVKVQEKTLADLHKTNRFVSELNKELIQQSEEIVSQNDALERQKNLIEDRNKEIISAIRFAKSIQQSLLPSEDRLSNYFSGYFLFNKPKAVISGDFFWMTEKDQKVFVAVVDCTGHGVPGAMVSMVINTLIGRAFTEIHKPDPSNVLHYINNALNHEFKGNASFQHQVGMDIALVSFDFSNNVLEYSGAFNPMLRIRGSVLTQLDASRCMMGITSQDKNNRFISRVLDIEKGDKIFLFSDGIIDQFGGENDKKFGFPRFRETLLSVSDYEMHKQNELIQSRWKEWKGVHMQTDDILILGLEI